MPISNWQPNLKGHTTKITSSHGAQAQIPRCQMHSSRLILHELTEHPVFNSCYAFCRASTEGERSYFILPGCLKGSLLLLGNQGYLKCPNGFREDSQVGEDKGNSEPVFILFPPRATLRVIKQNDTSLTAHISDLQKK